MNGKCLIFSAPSGSGKSTIVQWLTKEHPELNAYFICAGEGDSYEIHYTAGMERFMVKK